jgi:8-oxo-dGTP diphosphatase
VRRRPAEEETMTRSHVPRVGSAVVVRDGETILLGIRKKEPNRGKWVLPGGRIEPFESIADAARREIAEETGLLIDVNEQIGTFEIVAPPHEHRLIIFSWGSPVGGELRPASDILTLRFCHRDELAQLDLSEIVRAVLRKVGWLDEALEAAA